MRIWLSALQLHPSEALAVGSADDSSGCLLRSDSGSPPDDEGKVDDRSPHLGSGSLPKVGGSSVVDVDDDEEAKVVRDRATNSKRTPSAAILITNLRVQGNKGERPRAVILHGMI